MRRREFLSLLGGAAVAWPFAARAQQAVPVVGFLHPSSPEPFGHIINGFRRGLNDTGFVEGQNVAIEYRWARGDYDKLPALAADLVQRRVRVILAGGGEVGALAAKAATSTIPILIIASNDPVKSGLVASFNRPGGNLTGLMTATSVLETKKFGLLCEMVPGARVVAMLINPNYRRMLRTQLKCNRPPKVLGERGTKRTQNYVRYSVAVGVKADIEKAAFNKLDL